MQQNNSSGRGRRSIKQSHKCRSKYNTTEQANTTIRKPPQRQTNMSNKNRKIKTGNVYKHIATDSKNNSDEKKENNRNEPNNTVDIKYNAIRTKELALKTHQASSHVYHIVSWVKYMNQRWNNKNISRMQMRIVEAQKDVFTLNNIFSVKECQTLIYLSECHGYVPLLSALRGRKYRTNTRVIVEDKLLAKLWYARIKMFLPKTYKIRGQIWEICGLNERVRFCKYIKGQRFNIHYDKRLELPKQNKASFYTVNMYLNDGLKEYKGGKTIFYNLGKQRKWKESSFVIGRPGLALIFNHFPQKYKHSGQCVSYGTKYIVRTDVMYQLKVSR